MLRSLIDKLTRASLRFKWATIAITILLFVAGVVAFTQFNRELIPSIEFPQTVVLAFNPGDDAESILENVTIPIEDAVSEIDGIVNVESTTTKGFSFIVVRNEFGMNQDKLVLEIEEATASVALPDGVETPQVLSFSLSDRPQFLNFLIIVDTFFYRPFWRIYSFDFQVTGQEYFFGSRQCFLVGIHCVLHPLQ